MVEIKGGFLRLIKVISELLGKLKNSNRKWRYCPFCTRYIRNFSVSLSLTSIYDLFLWEFVFEIKGGFLRLIKFCSEPLWKLKKFQPEVELFDGYIWRPQNIVNFQTPLPLRLHIPQVFPILITLPSTFRLNPRPPYLCWRHICMVPYCLFCTRYIRKFSLSPSLTSIYDLFQ